MEQHPMFGKVEREEWNEVLKWGGSLETEARVAGMHCNATREKVCRSTGKTRARNLRSEVRILPAPQSFTAPADFVEQLRDTLNKKQP